MMINEHKPFARTRIKDKADFSLCQIRGPSCLTYFTLLVPQASYVKLAEAVLAQSPGSKSFCPYFYLATCFKTLTFFLCFHFENFM